MGKRSRKRGLAGQGPLPPRPTGAPRGARPTDLHSPKTSFAGRVKESWTVAGQRPAGELTRAERRERRLARLDARADERPPGLFGPYPISELLMAIGMVGLIIAFVAGIEENETTMLASVAVIALGTFELTAREHMRGFKPHSFFLAIIVTVTVHVVASTVGPDGTGSRPELLAVDIVVFGVAYWQFSVLYARARRRRKARTS